MAATQSELGMAIEGQPQDAQAVASRDRSVPSGRISHRLDQIIAGGLAVSVVFTALAHGAVEPWSRALFELTIIALVFAWGLKAVLDQRLPLRVPLAVLPLAGLAVIGFIQCLAVTGSDGVRRSLSMDVEGTRQTETMILILLCAFMIAANFFSTHKRTGLLAKFLIGFGFLLSVFGIVQSLAWNGKFYWLRTNSTGLSPFGPFVNHNNFAGCIEMLAPIPVGLIITRFARTEARLFYGFAAAIMAVAILASLSRGGIISLGAEAVFLAVLGPLVRRGETGHEESDEHSHTSSHSQGGFSINHRHVSFAKASLVALLLVAAITTAAIWMASDKVGGGAAATEPGRSTEETFYTSRGWIWRDTVAMIEARPILGFGLGAFATAYPIYSRSDGTIAVDRAHNDYLQIVADCGVLGAGLVIWFVFLMARAIFRGITSRDRMLAGFALGGGAGVFALAVHSIFDFNLQVPSNALLFLVITAQTSLIGAGLVEERRRRIIKHRSHDSIESAGNDGAILQELPQ
ncbi:MAG TPA: O-antigen ligase family protein [Blastocatellia bacterium]